MTISKDNKGTSWYAVSALRSPYFTAVSMLLLPCTIIAGLIIWNFGTKLGFERTVGLSVVPCVLGAAAWVYSLATHREIHELYLAGRIRAGEEDETIQVIETTARNATLSLLAWTLFIAFYFLLGVLLLFWSGVVRISAPAG
jgi:hypothetical protein